MKWVTIVTFWERRFRATVAAVQSLQAVLRGTSPQLRRDLARMPYSLFSTPMMILHASLVRNFNTVLLTQP
jgi:hypothetical protein